ncbi:HAD family hydrolase [Asanoa iriomotensis]|uniref:2-haloacid dehalogenase/putative hydrolase of the HAD superfamily n=1 Tax=Asanoa iriomotensis TaxID=234613 RepID=A0ABQ4CCE7_9ACTN|nr:HAD family hydrolase [Asanoa iriomotensis]GIF60010.1 hypothetical protein Air01nite_61050 [Asanoa iriomotensis]
MYEAILLDVYGTLVHDTEPRATEVIELIAGSAGMEYDTVARGWTDRIWPMADDAHGQAFRTLEDLDINSLEATATHFGVRVNAREIYHRPRPHPPLFQDARPFLEAVDVPVCLVSDADHDTLHALLDHHGISVAAVVTSEDARAYKPRPEPFELALRHLGRAAKNVIHVGDSPTSDIAGATALGIATAFLSRDGRRLPTNLTASYTISTLLALPHGRTT